MTRAGRILREVDLMEGVFSKAAKVGALGGAAVAGHYGGKHVVSKVSKYLADNPQHIEKAKTLYKGAKTALGLG